MEISINEFTFSQLQQATDAFDVGRLEPGRIIFATGSAGKTIDLPKSLLMEVREFLEDLVLVRPI
jgi:hypothetical protein